MRYMLLIYYKEKAMQARDEEQQQRVFREYLDYTLELQQAGVMRIGDALQGTATSRTHRLHEGAALAIDGPFAETKEQLGGIYVIDVGNMDEAVKWASKVPEAEGRSVEVRPILELPYPHAEQS
jgi:hypothetical protein